MPEQRFGDRDTIEYFLIYNALIQAAKKRETVTYKDLALLTGLPPSGNHMSSSLAWALGTISENEVNHHRPMLSSLCVKVEGRPGDGYYRYARELGLLNSQTPDAENAFWEDQKHQCYEIWQQRFNK